MEFIVFGVMLISTGSIHVSQTLLSQQTTNSWLQAPFVQCYKNKVEGMYDRANNAIASVRANPKVA